MGQRDLWAPGEKGLTRRDRPPGAEGEKRRAWGPWGQKGPEGSWTFRPNWTARAHRPHQESRVPRGRWPLGPQGETWSPWPGWKRSEEKRGKLAETRLAQESAFTVGLTVLSKFLLRHSHQVRQDPGHSEFGHYNVVTGKFTCHVAGVY